uniref:Glutaredoxin domain-containing protein n=1 Tax=Ananas comosus var. bracteatus TaxID=296719 RepID=A0A6V7NUS0_ANACO|nr:unnamed protein product [Ananas comosus var. bracteatus]
MGCASSKRVEAAVATADVYHPPPTSIALFDISAIEEPWLIATAAAVKEKEDDNDRHAKKPTEAATAIPLPLPLLEKLESYELAPASWSEVSKALEELKPALQNASKQSITTKLLPAAAPAVPKPPPTQPMPPSKTAAIHTLDDFDHQMKKTPPAELAGFRAVKENSFVVRDREERERRRAGGDDAAAVKWRRRDPFEGYPEKAPPGNAEGVVLYTTTLRGVRRTFEDCERARQVVEAYAAEAGISVDERDVSLHGEYLKEVKELAGEGAAVPRVFMRGRYVGGVEEVVELGESGRMREMMRWIAARLEKGGGGGGRRPGGCEGCGGARFMPCLDCSGSRKVVAEDGEGVERCARCNENGLILCPLCH